MCFSATSNYDFFTEKEQNCHEWGRVPSDATPHSELNIISKIHTGSQCAAEDYFRLAMSRLVDLIMTSQDRANLCRIYCCGRNQALRNAMPCAEKPGCNSLFGPGTIKSSPTAVSCTSATVAELHRNGCCEAWYRDERIAARTLRLQSSKEYFVKSKSVHAMVANHFLFRPTTSLTAERCSESLHSCEWRLRGKGKLLTYTKFGSHARSCFVIADLDGIHSTQPLVFVTCV